MKSLAQAMVQKRIKAKQANVHVNKGMNSPYAAGPAGTNRKSTRKASLKQGSGVSARLAGIKPGKGKGSNPRAVAKKASSKNSQKISARFAGTKPANS